MSPKHAVVTGCTQGLGKEICKSLSEKGIYVTGVAKEASYSKNVNDLFNSGYFIHYISASVESTDPDSIGRVIRGNIPRVDILVNNAGINYLSPFEKIKKSDFMNVLEVNIYGIVNITQALLPSLTESSGTVVNVVSNAARIPMTHSAAYNASKGGAEILTKQMARELTKLGITIFGINPNKLSGTKMSEYVDNLVPLLRNWTYEQAREYQLKGLLTGEETDPKAIAEMLGFLLEKKERHKHLSGCLLDVGA